MNHELHAVESCHTCPFGDDGTSYDDQLGWICHGVTTPEGWPTRLAAPGEGPPPTPPEWCPLRTSPRLIVLRTPETPELPEDQEQTVEPANRIFGRDIPRGVPVGTSVDLATLTALAAEITRWHDDDLAEDQECVRCRCPTYTPSEFESSPLCNLCAQDVASHVPGLVDHITALTAERYSLSAQPTELRSLAIADRDRAIEAMTARIAALLDRQQELLALIARISQETPLVDELAGWEAQRGAMIAEVGTLRARVTELEAEIKSLESDRSCPVHGGAIHGGEAEEFRKGIENLLEADIKVRRDSLIRLLDRVDARDSLAHLERQDRVAGLEATIAGKVKP